MDNIYIHGRCSHWQSHPGVRNRNKQKQSKTAHVKAKEQSHSRIYTALCRRAHKLTPRDTFTLSAHVFLG